MGVEASMGPQLASQRRPRFRKASLNWTKACKGLGTKDEKRRPTVAVEARYQTTKRA